MIARSRRPRTARALRGFGVGAGEKRKKRKGDPGGRPEGKKERGEEDAVEVTKIDDDGRQIRRATMRLNFSLSNRENEPSE